MASCNMKDRLIESANYLRHSRLLAASAPHTGTWLQALPLPNLGFISMTIVSVQTQVCIWVSQTVSRIYVAVVFR